MITLLLPTPATAPVPHLRLPAAARPTRGRRVPPGRGHAPSLLPPGRRGRGRASTGPRPAPLAPPDRNSAGCKRGVRPGARLAARSIPLATVLLPRDNDAAAPASSA